MSESLSQWTPAHAARIEYIAEQKILMFYDTVEYDYHFIRVQKEDYDGARIRLTIEAKPSDSGTRVLALNHWGGRDIAFVHANKSYVNRSADDVDVQDLEDGFIKIVFTWENDHSTVTIGSASTDLNLTMYDGQGCLQWTFRRIDLEILTPPQSRLSDENKRIVYVDIGARDGISAEWSSLRGAVRPVLVEPDEAEAKRLSNLYRKKFPDAVVLPVGLSNAAGSRTLFMTQTLGCSSLRRPNSGVLRRYPISHWFEVEREIEVECVRYEDLVAIGKAPVPDVLKIDVQGLEYEVLEGFGELLHNVVGVELEAHVYPIYTGQKLFTDIVSLLDRYDLALRAVRPQSYEGFAKECVELNAYFSKRNASIANIRCGEHKRNVCEEIWGVK